MASFNTDYKIDIPENTNHVSDLVFPTQEEIVQCSPNTTFATYKMAGSTGLLGKENQDSCSVVFIKWNGTKYTLSTVCDGHDIYGKQLSETVTTMLPKLIIERFEDVLENPNIVLKEIFSVVQSNLKTLFNNKHGGTTATVTIFTSGCLIVANVGDCEALLKINSPEGEIVFERNGNIDDTFVLDDSGVIRATVDHNCNNLEEVKRVLDTGSRILYASLYSTTTKIDVFTISTKDEIAQLVHTPYSNQIGGFVCNVSKEPAIYIVDDNTTLNMTKSFGDWTSTFISSIPDVTKITWAKEKQARLIVATDGYFNCIDKQVQGAELSFDLSPIDICTRAYEAVGKTFGYGNADNTTIVVFDNEI